MLIVGGRGGLVYAAGAIVELTPRPVEIDKREPDIGAHHLAQPRWGLGHHDLEGREYPPLEEVASAFRPIRQAGPESRPLTIHVRVLLPARSGSVRLATAAGITVTRPGGPVAVRRRAAKRATTSPTAGSRVPGPGTGR